MLGGSFDPIHFGHIKPALELARLYQLESIRLLPCKVSPFKDDTFASSQHRWNMVSIIAAGSNELVADARELERDGPSYTYTTVVELSEELGADVKLFWILGADALNEFPDWYEAEKLMQYCHVLVLNRPGYELPKDAEKLGWLQRYLCEDVNQLEQKDAGCIFISETGMLDISSTRIRELIQAGEQPRFMLPGAVWNYIQRNKLYS